LVPHGGLEPPALNSPVGVRLWPVRLLFGRQTRLSAEYCLSNFRTPKTIESRCGFEPASLPRRKTVSRLARKRYHQRRNHQRRTGNSVGTGTLSRRVVEAGFLGSPQENAGYPLDFTTTFQCLPLTMVCTIRGPVLRHYPGICDRLFCSIGSPFPRHHAPPRRQHRKAASSHPSPPLPGLSPVSSDTKPRARSGAAPHSTTTMERGGNPPGEAPQQASEHEGRGDAPTSRGGIYLDSGETTGSPITRPRRRKQS
jgi:hypothetical protein